MKAFKVNLKEEYSFLEGGILECILTEKVMDGADDWKRPAVVVVPGGAYAYTSRREGEPIANAFQGKGFQTFILWYACEPDGVRYPEQLLELAAAMDYVRKNAKEFCVNPEEVFPVGFSAGGHLVGNLAVEHQNVEQKIGQELACKPTAVGLCYPVISQIHGHQGSYDNLLNGYTDEAKTELLKTLNLNEAVSEQTPPAFIWSTVEDSAVPTDNALRFAMAMDKFRIPYELHVYPLGWHGLSTADYEVNAPNEQIKKVRRWVDDCAEFFRLYIKETY